MLGHTHALIGLTALAAAQAMSGFIQPHPLGGLPAGPFLCAGAAILGALLPDIDGQDSTIRGELGLAGGCLAGLLRLLRVKHRGLTHFGLTGLLVCLAGAWLGQQSGYPDLGLALGLGYLSHLLADALTLSGAPLLWPLPGRIHLLPRPFRVRTGGPSERLIFLLVGAALLCLLPALIPADLPALLARLSQGVR